MQLEHLSLDNNQIGGSGTCLATMFVHLVGCKTLSFCKCGLTGKDLCQIEEKVSDADIKVSLCF